MSSSGSIDFNRTRNQIISGALRKCGQLAEGETATSQQVDDAAADLNGMVKVWQKEGLHLWTLQELVLLLDTSSQNYDLGATGDRLVAADSLVTTTITAAAALGASTLTLASVTGISTTYAIGLVQDDDTIHWTTVNGAPAGLVVTLTAVTTAAAASGNVVYVYASLAGRPLGIEQARIQTSSTSETEMQPMSRGDYFALSNKSATGVPIQYHYSPVLTNGRLYIWPVADTVAYKINITARRSIEDFDASGDTPDLPQEWIQALIWGLAEEIKMEYGIDPITSAEIAKKAGEWYIRVSDFDVADESMMISPDFGW